MLREDLAEARKQWLSKAKDDPQEYAQRQQSDFLTDFNHEGERIDFHSLRHTCGAWLAMTGTHPKCVQQVLRHQSITLTMDTYGHLFPGQEADAVARLGSMLTETGDSRPPESLRATGTDDLPIDGHENAQRTAQCAARETPRTDASPRDDDGRGDEKKKSPKPLQIADLDDGLRDNAFVDVSSGGGIRTPDTRIMIPLHGPQTVEEVTDFESCAADGAALIHGSSGSAPDLQVVIDVWLTLSESDRSAILAIIRGGQQGPSGE